MIVYAGAYYICHVMIIRFVKDAPSHSYYVLLALHRVIRLEQQCACMALLLLYNIIHNVHKEITL